MEAKRPAAVTIAAILILVLTLFAAGFGLARQYGLLRLGSGSRQFAPGQFQGRSFNPQGGFPNGSAPNDGSIPGGVQPFSGSGAPRLNLFRLVRLIRPILTGLNIVIAGLGILAALGLFKTKRWAAVLAIVLALLLFLGALPGMLRIFSWVVLAENLLRMGLAAAVCVLLLLPAARNSYT